MVSTWPPAVPILRDTDPVVASAATAHPVPRTLYIRPHVERDLSRHLRRPPHGRAQRLGHGPGARGRDLALRVRRGHPAPDDALRGELCPVRDLLHAFSCGSLPGRDRAGPHARAADTRGADDAVRPEGGEEAPDASAPTRSGAGPLRDRDTGSEARRRNWGKGKRERGNVQHSRIRYRAWRGIRRVCAEGARTSWTIRSRESAHRGRA